MPMLFFLEEYRRKLTPVLQKCKRMIGATIRPIQRRLARVELPDFQLISQGWPPKTKFTDCAQD